MTAILGISAYYHDSAAALVIDGEIVAAAQEERFTRKKHDHEFPPMPFPFVLNRPAFWVPNPTHSGFYTKPSRSSSASWKPTSPMRP